MTFHSWRLCGITATIIIYVFSILLLSFNTSPSSSRQRREHLEQFLEVGHISIFLQKDGCYVCKTNFFLQYPNYKHRRVSGLAHRATISWCTELKYFSLKETDNSKHHNVASTFSKICIFLKQILFVEINFYFRFFQITFAVSMILSGLYV